MGHVHDAEQKKSNVLVCLFFFIFIESCVILLDIQGLEFDSSLNQITINESRPRRAALKAGNDPPPFCLVLSKFEATRSINRKYINNI